MLPPASIIHKSPLTVELLINPPIKYISPSFEEREFTAAP